MNQKTYEELVIENQKLKNEVKEKDIKIKEKNIEITNLKIKVENQELHINALNRYIFGSKREKTTKEENIVEGTQCSIFGEPDNKELKEQIEEKTEEIIVHRKKKARNKKIRIKKYRNRNKRICIRRKSIKLS